MINSSPAKMPSAIETIPESKAPLSHQRTKPLRHKDRYVLHPSRNLTDLFIAAESSQHLALYELQESNPHEVLRKLDSTSSMWLVLVCFK